MIEYREGKASARSWYSNFIINMIVSQAIINIIIYQLLIILVKYNLINKLRYLLFVFISKYTYC